MRQGAGSGRAALAVLGLALVLGLLALGCGDPLTTFEVENRTDEELTVFLEVEYRGETKTARMGAVGSGKTGTVGTTMPPNWLRAEGFFIRVESAPTVIVYLRETSWEEMEERNWRIVIPPPGGENSR